MCIIIKVSINQSIFICILVKFCLHLCLRAQSDDRFSKGELPGKPSSPLIFFRITKLSENKAYEVMGGTTLLFIDQDNVIVLSDIETCSRSLSHDKPISLVNP